VENSQKKTYLEDVAVLNKDQHDQQCCTCRFIWDHVPHTWTDIV